MHPYLELDVQDHIVEVVRRALEELIVSRA